MKPTWLRLKENPYLMHSYLTRSLVIQAIRAYFTSQGFFEVETPIMVKSPGMEPYLDVFSTYLLDEHGVAHEAFLHTSPEYAMKKLLVAGLPRIFQICKVFRNGEDLRSTTHNPEFTMIEWYRVHSDYFDLMVDCEEVVCAIFDYLFGRHIDICVSDNHFLFDFPHLQKKDGLRVLVYQGHEVILDPPWERITVADAFAHYAHVSEESLHSDEAMRRIALQKGYFVDAGTTWEQIYHQIFLNEIEPHLGVVRPTIVYDYPASMAALSRKKQSDTRYAERLEFYILGKELGNGFSELTDAREQEERLRTEWEERKRLGKKLYSIDDDFISALSVGMPDAAGIAVGVDRLVMLFANVLSIQETLWFPANELFA